MTESSCFESGSGAPAAGTCDEHWAREAAAMAERHKSAQAERLAKIALLPCATCTIGTAEARACRFYGQSDCKHEAEVARLREEARAVDQRWQNLRETPGLQVDTRNATIQ